MTMRLIPTEKNYGWTPYVWLIYIVPFLMAPFYLHQAPLRIALTLAAGAVFIVLYFRAYWLHGAPLLWVIAAMLAVAVVFLPLNLGAGALFIYAGSFAGGLHQPRRGAWLLAAVVAVLLIEAWILGFSVALWWWAALFTVIVGAVNIHYAQVHRQNERLRMAHDEVEHLAKVAERERIARDLHDLLGHTLSLIVLKAELAGRLTDPERARAEIRDVERISREALAEVRAAVSGYRGGGLQHELAQAREALKTAGVRVECSVEPVTLPATHEVVLELAVREAVTNVIRHAGAKHCSISIGTIGGVCRLTVTDDGRGGAAADGFGLMGMRERVAALGGTLVVSSAQGTSLTIELPVAGGSLHVLERGA